MTYGNTQTQVTERQTEDTGITHKRTTDKDWPKERTSTTKTQMKDKVLQVSVDSQRCLGLWEQTRNLRFDRSLLLPGGFILILVFQLPDVIVVIFIVIVIG